MVCDMYDKRRLVTWSLGLAAFESPRTYCQCFFCYSDISWESLKAKSLTQIISQGISSDVPRNKLYKETG